VTEAEYTNRFDLAALITVDEANAGRRGRKLKTAALEGSLHRTRSPLEDRFLRFREPLGRRGAGVWVWVEGYEVDFVWTRVGLVVELDGVPRTARAGPSMRIDCVTGCSGGRASGRCA
jgi:hypothetical protein